MSDQAAREMNIVAVYDYKDRFDQEVLYQVVRLEPKSFRQRRPDGNGGWIWNLNGVPRVPYRLCEVLGSPPEIVFVTEGEKDTESLRAMGFVATTNAGGANTRWTVEMVAYLAGRDVVVLADNDGPGLTHADAVAAALYPVAKSVRIVWLSGLPPKGDISDWFEAGHSPKELQEIVQATPLWEPPAAEVDPVEAPDPDEEQAAPGRLPITEVSNAERFVARFQQEIRYASDRRTWCVWNGTHWTVNDVTGVSRRMQQIARGIYFEAASEENEDLRTAFAKWAQKSESQSVQISSIDAARCHVEVQKFSSVFDTHQHALNVSNGTIQLRDEKTQTSPEFYPHRREDFITKKVDIEYHPEGRFVQRRTTHSYLPGSQRHAAAYDGCALDAFWQPSKHAPSGCDRTAARHLEAGARIPTVPETAGRDSRMASARAG